MKLICGENMLYYDVVEEIKNNKNRRKSGDVIAIPWSLPRLSAVLPGIEKGRYNLISATAKAYPCKHGTIFVVII